ncbi:MAG: mycothione reductase [Actinomycetota bacterium]
MDTFDLIIIGTGSGNAIPEEFADWKIALVERGVFGGTCLNVGCIPSKMFVLPADLATAVRHSGNLGLDLSFNGADWPAIRDRVFGRIDPIAAGGEEYRASGTPNVELIRGTARFTGRKVLDVDGRTIGADRIMVATGSRAVMPPIPGLVDGPDKVRVHTSDTIMRLETLPERLAIIGGGFIAAELGHVFSGYGSAVTLFNRSNVLLRSGDGEIATRFTEVFGRRVDLHLGHVPERVEQVGETLHIHVGDEVFEADELLVATGRIPNADLVAAEAGGLDLHEDGRIKVDETMATSVDGVWAIGDVANAYQLKHLANAEAKVAFWNMRHPDSQRTVDYRAVPQAVFSNPQTASVGLTEEEAAAGGYDYVVGSRDYGGTAYGWAMEDSDSFAKVIIDRSSGLLLGAHIIGSQAASLLQPLIQAMQFGQTAEAVANDVFYIHPALTEVVENALLEGVSKLSESPS